MSRLETIQAQRARRQNRTRKSLEVTADRPRLTVTISNKHVSAQIIDDVAHKTVVAVSSVSKKSLDKKPLTAVAEWAGAEIAKKAKAKKVTQAVLDRGHKAYHGRVKAFAEAARKEGLEI